MEQKIIERRYDVDWLRTGAFALLILYHIGMYYVAEWDWHIKSVVQSTLLQDFMILSNQWRMALLFFVSGMTLALVEGKYSVGGLLKTRFLRLFIPLLFGMLVVVPPQLYFELIEDGLQFDNYWQFYAQYIQPDTELAPHKQSPIGLLTWNHLWYLAYLWVYTWIFLALKPVLSRVVSSDRFGALSPLQGVIIAIGSILAVWFYLRLSFPSTHALVDDWYNHGKFFTVMLLGYCFVHQKVWWNSVIEYHKWWLLLACITYSLIIIDRHGGFPQAAAMFQTHDSIRIAYGLIFVTNMWAWLLTCVGFAGKYLNRPSRLLHYGNEAVLAWYILHQTLIVLAAVSLRYLSLPVIVEVPLLIVLTLAGCFLGYEIIKRVNIFRLLFGIKINHKHKACKQLQVN